MNVPRWVWIAAALAGGVAIAKPAHTPWSFALYPAPPEQDKGEFYAWLGPMARDTQRRSGIPASVRMAQAWRESRQTGGGLSALAIDGRNLYGMKRGGCTGHYASGSGHYPTWEVRADGSREEVRAEFMHYPSHYASTLQQCRLFYCALAYWPALAHRADPLLFLAHMAPVYATDPNYAAAIANDIDHWDLTRWDLTPWEWDLEGDIVGERHLATWRRAVGA